MAETFHTITSGPAADDTVDLIVEAAFGVDPFDTGVTWTDITAYVRQFSTRSGRSRILDRTQTGTAQIVLSNGDGRFDPGNTAGAYYPDINVTTPIRIRSRYNVDGGGSDTVGMWRGFVTDWGLAYPGMKDAIAVVSAADAFGLFAKFEEEFTLTEDMSGTRIDDILDEVGWPSAWRQTATGTHVVAGISEEFNSALGEMQRAELVEQGFLVVDGAGDVRFYDSDRRLNASTAYTFSDDGSDNPYVDFEHDYDDTQFWNAVHVTRVDGVEQSRTSPTSITKHGQHDLHISQTLHHADGEADALAAWLRNEYATVRPRISQVVLSPLVATGLTYPNTVWQTIQDATFWDRVNVEHTPPAGDTLDKHFFIEGVAHDVSVAGGKSWRTTYTLSPNLTDEDWWVLGTSELDTETRLAY